MANETVYDLIVIGGGPGGYVGAIRAGQLGKKVACVEKHKLGGVCLNYGCIPTKALLKVAEFYSDMQHKAGDWGIATGDHSYDWERVIGRSRGIAKQMNGGISFLLKKNKIDHVVGTARILNANIKGKPCRVEVTDDAGDKQTLVGHQILITTGAQARELPGLPFDGKKVLNAKDAMTTLDQAKELVIVGSGAIGMEFAYIYHAFGTKVTLIEMMDHLLPIEDHDVSRAIEKEYRGHGIDFKLKSKTLKIETTGDGVAVHVAPLSDESAVEVIRADKVLVAIGVTGRYAGLFSDAVGIKTDRGAIVVDKKTYETDAKGIYAAGDVIGPPWLAHVASEEAINAVETMFGHAIHAIDYEAIPGCTYCVPQVASMGRTEQSLKEAGLKKDVDYRVGMFPFQASGKAQAGGHAEGFVKILSCVKYGEILGVHMVGDHVTELLAEMGLAKRLEATVDEIISTMHAHPTLSEAVHEAALGTQGRAIHF